MLSWYGRGWLEIMSLHFFVDLNENVGSTKEPQYVFKKGSDGLNRMDIYCDGKCVASVRFKYLYDQ
jgi:hypothetical protein